MARANEVKLSDLVGEHWLSGVDTDVVVEERDWTRRTQDAEAVRFRLDGKTYTAVQDPNDGYRSSMDYLAVGDEPVKNKFPKVKVICEHVSARIGGYRDYPCDVLEMKVVRTGKVVLAIGTENTDDYYPCWVGRFDPTAM